MGELEFRIGVSGHQRLGDETTLDFVSQQFKQLLIEYREQARQWGKDIVMYSALAMGADQLFVRIALELAIPFEVVIPCACYDEIFLSPEDLNEYYRLLGLCRKVHQLPSPDCSDEAYLAAGQWIVEHSDLVILAWNGYPAAGRGGTADVANYARFLRRPFVHIHTRLHTTKLYGGLASEQEKAHVPTSRQFAVSKQKVYQGPVLTVNQYNLRMPDGEEIVRDIVERPESVLVLPVGQQGTVLLIEEYDLGAEAWQLTLPGGKVDDPALDGILERATAELREETGYKAGRIEKLLDFYSHPGYIAHKVHLFIAYDLEWDPLNMDEQEMIQVQTYTLDEALAATQIDYRCDPEAALALWLYAGKLGLLK
jgi:8-oxo-dGTP pyrophosphatase MutT (NUDIX family)